MAGFEINWWVPSPDRLWLAHTRIADRSIRAALNNRFPRSYADATDFFGLYGYRGLYAGSLSCHMIVRHLGRVASGESSGTVPRSCRSGLTSPRMGPRLHIHLDPLGGIAGDMFAAAILDAFPEHGRGAVEAAQALAPVSAGQVPHRDHVLAGSRFRVEVRERSGHHDHCHWSDIRALLERCALPQAVRAHAVGIFTHLARAESKVHGVLADDVAFHEVGAADSIADIVAAAWLIVALGEPTWSVSALPLGGGMVRTAHGMLPVPAPATALLLEGFAMRDDGVAGERVTPTGAAILRHLEHVACPSGRLLRSGIGFGMRALPGMSNCLRLLAFDTDEVAAAPAHRELLVVSFEVDDQSGEDLAAGVGHLRALAGVHDVLLLQAFGKKNRPATQIQVLADPGRTEAVVAACFAQTTTIGLRTHVVAARALTRRIATADIDGQSVRVKIVARPEGETGKVEADDLAAGSTHAERSRLRRRAEEACR